MTMTTHMDQPSLRLVGVPWAERLLDALAAVAAPAQQASPQWRLERNEELRLHTDVPPTRPADRELAAAVPDLVRRILGATWAARSEESSGLVVDVDALGKLAGLYHASVSGPWSLTTPTPEAYDWEWCVLEGEREVLAGPYDSWDDTLIGYYATDPDDTEDPRTTPALELLVAARDAIPALATALAQAVIHHQPDTTRIDAVIADLRAGGEPDRADALAATMGYGESGEDLPATPCTVCDMAWPCPTLAHIHRHITPE